MYVDIRGTQTSNKGAQLMLEAVVDRLGAEYQLSAPPLNSEYIVRAKLGLFQTLHVSRFPAQSATLGNFMPARLRRAYGLAADKEITGVLDASGFAYGDTFGTPRMKSEAAFFRRWGRRNVPIVMLPQAYGPFNDPEKKNWAKIVLENSRLIFARDAVSAEHLAELNLSTPIRMSPDFTIGLKAEPLERITRQPFVALVPNKMMTITGATSAPEYLRVLAHYGEAARNHGLDVVVVVHESGDRTLAQEVASALDAQIFQHHRPRVLKAVLGQADLVVSSRFHAVVGGLSQGVPTIALGWSHKYLELLRDFGVEQWLSSVEDSPDGSVRDVLLDSAGRADVQERKAHLVVRVSEMWDATMQVLGHDMSNRNGFRERYG